MRTGCECVGRLLARGTLGNEEHLYSQATCLKLAVRHCAVEGHAVSMLLSA